MTRNQFLKLILAGITSTVGKQGLFSESLNTQKEVIIIGAGIAGLAAARKLSKEGFQVTILEGRNRIGGRIWTNDSMGNPIEMGCGFLSNFSENPIIKLGEQFKLTPKEFPLEEVELFDTNGKDLPKEGNVDIKKHYETFLKKLHLAKDSLKKEKSFESVKDKIISELVLTEKERDSLFSLLSSNLKYKYGTELKNLALDHIDENSLSQNSISLFEEGFSEIINHLAYGINIKTSHIVSKIEYDKKVTITTNQGEFTSDYAIVTIPLGVLKKKKIQFVPDLPEEKKITIEKMGLGTINKVFLKFPKKFWSSDTKRFQLIDNLEFWNFNSSNETPILSTMFIGENAISLEKRSKQDIQKESISALKKIFGNKIPTPLETQFSKWNLDPFSSGTSSYLSTQSLKDSYQVLAEPIGELIFFAGEATNSKYPNSVHGAYLSGEREANRILKITRN